MKKWLFLLGISNSVFALYMGNPALPGMVDEGFLFCKENWFAVKVGYQRDWVFDRDMKAVSKVTGRMDEFELISDRGVLTFNLFNRVELYGSAGAARIFASHRPMKTIRDEYESSDQFMWGIGGRGLFATWGKGSFGIDLAYERTYPTIKWMTINGVPVTPRRGSKITYHEWQVGVGAAYQIAIFFPYIAVKYSNASARFKHLPVGFFKAGRHFNAKNRRKFGMALGTTLSTGSRFSASVEARVIDENSLTLAAEIKF
ncbi:MAG: Major outer membrane porin [Chlamydiae bacterium]|nr:Major outer membrane porin [Chlamydiota bacterium]